MLVNDFGAIAYLLTYRIQTDFNFFTFCGLEENVGMTT